MSNLTLGSISGMPLNGNVVTVPSGHTIKQSGMILQVAQAAKTNVFATSSTAYVDVTGLSVTITPKFSTSKIFISGTVAIGMTTTAAYSMFGRLMRNGSPIFIADADGNRDRGTFSYQSGGAEGPFFQSFEFLDAPNTTSATTYNVQIRAESPQTMYINRGYEADGDSSITPRVVSSITVMEVAV